MDEAFGPQAGHPALVASEPGLFLSLHGGPEGSQDRRLDHHAISNQDLDGFFGQSPFQEKGLPFSRGFKGPPQCDQTGLKGSLAGLVEANLARMTPDSSLILQGVGVSLEEGGDHAGVTDTQLGFQSDVAGGDHAFPKHALHPVDTLRKGWACAQNGQAQGRQDGESVCHG